MWSQLEENMQFPGKSVKYFSGVKYFSFSHYLADHVNVSKGRPHIMSSVKFTISSELWKDEEIQTKLLKLTIVNFVRPA